MNDNTTARPWRAPWTVTTVLTPSPDLSDATPPLPRCATPGGAQRALDLYATGADRGAWRREARESFWTLHLDGRHTVRAIERVSTGTADSCPVHPREVYGGAVRSGAVAIIVAHHHPGGDPTPSEPDVAVTRRLIEAGRLLGIPLLDHIIGVPDPQGSAASLRTWHAAIWPDAGHGPGADYAHDAAREAGPVETFEAYRATCNGSPCLYHHRLARGFSHTQGVELLAREARADWLIDAIASHAAAGRLRGIQFAVVRLRPHKDGAILDAHHDLPTTRRTLIMRQVIPWSDFPFGEPALAAAAARLYFEHGTLMLPEER